MRALCAAAVVLAFTSFGTQAEPRFSWNTSQASIEIAARNKDPRRYNCIARFTIVADGVKRNYSVAFAISATSDQVIYSYTVPARNWSLKSRMAKCALNGSPAIADPQVLAIAPAPQQQEWPPQTGAADEDPQAYSPSPCLSYPKPDYVWVGHCAWYAQRQAEADAAAQQLQKDKEEREREEEEKKKRKQ